jgi:hypothetical protein
MADRLQRVMLLCGLTLASVSFATIVLADEASLDLSQIPYYDKTNDGYKASIKLYAAAKGPKALAMNPNGHGYWWGAVAHQAEAIRRVLENCELSNKSPCVLAAIDDAVQKVDPAAKPVSAFAELGNELDPNKVPFLSDAARKSLAASLENARKSSPQYMALALNPRNVWFLKFDPAFASQADADDAALAACVSFTPPNKYWNRGSCLLFSQGTQIVANLPLNVTFARTAMVQAAGPSLQKMTLAPTRVDFVYFGAVDCPNCVGWEAYDLPKLKASALFQKVRFTKVPKLIRSPVPSTFWFPEQIKHLRDPIAEKIQGAGSPMFAILADDKVVLAWKGTWRGPDAILKIFAKQFGEPSSARAPN